MGTKVGRFPKTDSFFREKRLFSPILPKFLFLFALFPLRFFRMVEIVVGIRFLFGRRYCVDPEGRSVRKRKETQLNPIDPGKKRRLGTAAKMLESRLIDIIPSPPNSIAGQWELNRGKAAASVEEQGFAVSR